VAVVVEMRNRVDGVLAYRHLVQQLAEGAFERFLGTFPAYPGPRDELFVHRFREGFTDLMLLENPGGGWWPEPPEACGQGYLLGYWFAQAEIMNRWMNP